MVMQKIIEVCVCTIDFTPCTINRYCLKCKKFKQYELQNKSNEYEYVLKNWRG